MVGKRGPWHHTVEEIMKIALESHEGVRGCHFVVVEIDKSTQNSQVKKIPGISFLHNSMFFDDGIQAWKAYQIEEGHSYPYSSIKTNAQEGTAVKVLIRFRHHLIALGLQWLGIPPFPPACSLVRKKDVLRCFLPTKNFSII